MAERMIKNFIKFITFESPMSKKCKATCKTECCLTCKSFVSAEMEPARPYWLLKVYCTSKPNSVFNMKTGMASCYFYKYYKT